MDGLPLARFPLLALGLALLGLAVPACRRGSSRVTQDASPDEKTIPKTGGCRNIDTAGKCRFAYVSSLGTRDSDPPNTSVVRVVHSLEMEAGSFEQTSESLRIPTDARAKVQQYYAEHSPVSCRAHIIRPPCNDTMSTLTLDLPPPPYATKVRP